MPTTMPDWKGLRDEFPALANWTYLNTATYGQIPRRAAAAMCHHLARRDEFACGDYLAWFDDMDAIRESCARLVHCQASDIAFVINAATGLAALLQGLSWQPGDELLTLADEFPNQLYASAGLARFGARLRAVAWSEFYESVNERTRLVVLSTVNYATGVRPPLAEISRFLRERGVLLYVDGSQSVGALQFDIEQVRPSALCVDAYKWMLSANGAGFLYVDPELRERLPATVVGWRSDRDWRSVNSLNHGEPVFAQSAEKYEGGMLPFSSLYGMGAVIDLMLQLGAGGDRSARAGAGRAGQSDVAWPGSAGERGRIANCDGGPPRPGFRRIGAVAPGAPHPGVGAARQAARLPALLQRRGRPGNTAECAVVSGA